MRIGSDLQSIAELRGKRGLFGNRAVFTADELAHCQRRIDPVASLAGLLSAKEACIKVLSSFERLPAITFVDLEIHHQASGRPYLRAGGKLAAWLERERLQLDVSISHTGDHAMAVAIAVAA